MFHRQPRMLMRSHMIVLVMRRSRRLMRVRSLQMTFSRRRVMCSRHNRTPAHRMPPHPPRLHTGLTAPRRRSRNAYTSLPGCLHVVAQMKDRLNAGSSRQQGPLLMLFQRLVVLRHVHRQAKISLIPKEATQPGPIARPPHRSLAKRKSAESPGNFTSESSALPNP